jgi:hypothetical protein
MPSFNPNQMQGSVSTALTPISNVTPTPLLEWGHFINTSTNLLIVNGGVQINATATVSVTLTLVQDGVTIDTRVIGPLATAAAESSTISFGSRQQNLAVGHHVYQVLALASAAGSVSADDRNGFSISGPAS